MTLQAVVSLLNKNLVGKPCVQAARHAGRITLSRAAELSSAPFAGKKVEFPRNEEGAPLPLEGWFWSLSHTRGLVCSTLAPRPIGIDVEWLERRRWRHTRDYFEGAVPGELDCVGGTDTLDVLTLWAAKESVLKRAGIGLSDLGRCPLVARIDDDCFLFEHRGQRVIVQRLIFGQHIIALAYGEGVPCKIVSIPEFLM
ncbi:MAG: hypothetical protein CMJ89_05160 [Planctomycetes bacterium]|nr:hypothetical protein [Planctomycetota bacterium]